MCQPLFQAFTGMKYFNSHNSSMGLLSLSSHSHIIDVQLVTEQYPGQVTQLESGRVEV
jgi:hypothetical protein